VETREVFQQMGRLTVAIKYVEAVENHGDDGLLHQTMQMYTWGPQGWFECGEGGKASCYRSRQAWPLRSESMSGRDRAGPQSPRGGDGRLSWKHWRPSHWEADGEACGGITGEVWRLKESMGKSPSAAALADFHGAWSRRRLLPRERHPWALQRMQSL
jgi:hypothetical protein